MAHLIVIANFSNVIAVITLLLKTALLKDGNLLAPLTANTPFPKGLKCYKKDPFVVSLAAENIPSVPT